MRVSEIFLSIQGESTYSGLPCVFVRLAGCNLACDWCDTPYARSISEGVEMPVEEILSRVASYGCRLVEITGGEPLLQSETRELTERLLDGSYKVLLETNGSVSLEGLDARLIKVVDVKCPSSGQAPTFLTGNLALLGAEDEVKFVIADRADYEFARRFKLEYLSEKATRVLFAPVRPALEPGTLASWILEDRLNVRLQVQMHKYVWGDERGR